MRKAALATLTMLATAWAIAPSLAQEGSAASGQKLFQQRCGGCHQAATPRNGVGPSLQGVIGRKAGSVEGFNYSPALKASGITWTSDRVEAFLANPMAMVRGTRMAQRFNNADERRAIVEFLSNNK